MKKMILSFGLLLGVLATRSAADTFSNAGFESAAFTDWSLHLDLGVLGLPRAGLGPPGPYPIVPGSVVSSFPLEMLEPILPHAGNYFAAFEIGGQGILIETTSTYFSFLNQDIYFSSGDQLSGWASFADGDLAAQDSAFVRILDQTGTVIATPWQAVSGNNPLLTPRIVTPWTLWEWTAAAPGIYTVQLGATTEGDNFDPSEAFFDDLIVTPVPEPQMLSIVVVGLAGLFRILCRKRA